MRVIELLKILYPDITEVGRYTSKPDRFNMPHGYASTKKSLYSYRDQKILQGRYSGLGAVFAVKRLKINKYGERYIYFRIMKFSLNHDLVLLRGYREFRECYDAFNSVKTIKTQSEKQIESFETVRAI